MTKNPSLFSFRIFFAKCLPGFGELLPQEQGWLSFFDSLTIYSESSWTLESNSRLCHDFDDAKAETASRRLGCQDGMTLINWPACSTRFFQVTLFRVLRLSDLYPLRNSKEFKGHLQEAGNQDWTACSACLVLSIVCVCLCSALKIHVRPTE